MSKVVNLRQARKQRDRADKKTSAAATAAQYGRTKAEQAADEKTVTAARKHLDDHKREEP